MMSMLLDKALKPGIKSTVKAELRENGGGKSRLTPPLYSATIAIKFTAPRFSGGWLEF